MCITFVDWWIKAVHYLYKNLAIHKYFRLLLIISPALPLRFDLLSIIAYKQPITKLAIENIRGVKSDHAVNKLVEYNLVCEIGRLDAPGKPIVFGTTEEFLRNFGINSLDELPIINSDKIEDFKAQALEEAEQQLNEDADEEEINIEV